MLHATNSSLPSTGYFRFRERLRELELYRVDVCKGRMIAIKIEWWVSLLLLS